MKTNEEKLLERLLSLGRECQWLEYKVNYDGGGKLHDYIAEYISALSNSAAHNGKEKKIKTEKYLSKFTWRNEYLTISS